MRFLGIGIAFTMAASIAAAQPTDMKEFASSADVKAMIAKAKREHKSDQANFVQPILKLAPYTANLEYRTGVAPASVHEKQAEMFYVIEGSGTLTTGGKLAGEKRLNPANLSGTGIDDGSSRHVAPGDFVIVPENTPHWFNKIDGGALVLMSIHIPRPVAE